MRTAIAAARRQTAFPIVVAVPTGHESAVEMIAELADEVYCANIRGGFSFAVADAYEQWSDVSEDEIGDTLLGWNANKRAATVTYITSRVMPFR